MISALRPAQWSKNAVVFAALVFGGQLNQPGRVIAVIVLAAAFCLASSAVYIVNDLFDRERDRLHPTKRFRPVASGRVSQGRAVLIAAGCASGALGLSLWAGPESAIWVGAYLALMATYSAWLKHVPIVDVSVIASGFLIRGLAGAVAADVPVSPWLLSCTILLALFLGFAKRRNETLALETGAATHRPALRGYSVRVLDTLIATSAAACIGVYAAYATTSNTAPQGTAMEVTIPFVVVAIGRYLYLVYHRSLGGAPESVLFTDRSLLAAVIMWGASVLIVLA